MAITLQGGTMQILPRIYQLKYILDAQHRAVRLPFPDPDEDRDGFLAALRTWGEFYSDLKRRTVGQDRYCGRVLVSTVFLGSDHGWGEPDDLPVLFETMIFGGTYDQEQYRYRTWDEAKAGHARWCRLVQYADGKRGYSRSHWRKIRSAFEPSNIPSYLITA